jgi:hypothetical protein
MKDKGGKHNRSLAKCAEKEKKRASHISVVSAKTKETYISFFENA